MNFVFVNTQFLFFFSPTMFSGRGGLEERIIFSFTRLSLMTVVLPVVGASVVAPAVGLENGGGEKEREGREKIKVLSKVDSVDLLGGGSDLLQSVCAFTAYCFSCRSTII